MGEVRAVRAGRLGRDFGWLWAAFAVSSAGTMLAFDAFALIAVTVLHSSPARVSFLAAAGVAAGAVFAVPLGPWVEFRRKRPVMIGADLLRCAALLTLPVAYALDALSYAQLVLVSVVVATADIVFRSASGAHLKALVPQDGLMTASARFESTTWTTTALGPPLGGAAIGLFGPVTTVVGDALSYLLSAVGVRAVRAPEPEPPARTGDRLTAADLAEGWRYLWRTPYLRALFLNSTLVNGLIMVGAPLMAVLMLRELGFPPWEYGLAYGIPCIGGLIGSRLSSRLVHRYGEQRVLRWSGTARVCWPVGLALTGTGTGGLLTVIVVELGLITCIGVYNPVLAKERLRHTDTDRLARVLTAWTVTGRAVTATLTLTWGALASFIGTRPALAVAGVLLLATPALLPTAPRDSLPRRTPRTPSAGP
ncbi:MULTISPECIES: MFS transporter [unclassified Streptomyces]|uniref:MFS transporter n=1 Tax=unclassified Streptomyces TaxID=2593676 RepID=UPI000DBA5217|nr:MULTISPECIES: MFS transporter [unclassified Streptomyces]MYT70069.1 MFS transporter [Streptomyces sp. SID8367]RAJ88642.1 MFS transporter [Streptomyces sp. PsTaAH-137]